MDCKLTKSVYDDYWVTADPKDYNVRKRVTDVDPVTEEDFNNQVRSNGQDWYVEM